MNSGKILIVEDEPIVAMDLKEEVQEMGYDVVGVAESADDALMIVQDTAPDFVLMDIRIVGSMDGIQTARVLRRLYRVPSIFLTSYSDNATLARAARTMPYGYLTKPFKSPELKAALRMALHRSRAEAREFDERLRITDTFNGMPEGIITVNCKGIVGFMNYAAETLTGWNAWAAKEKPIQEVLQWSTAQTTPVPLLGEWTNVNEGEWFGCAIARSCEDKSYVDLCLAKLTDSNGEQRGYVISLRDASERMRRQALEEIEQERPCFDRASMAMIQLDEKGRIERINEALLRETGIPAQSVLGKTLTSLNMDPDPRIVSGLIPKLLKNSTIVTTTETPPLPN